MTLPTGPPRTHPEFPFLEVYGDGEIYRRERTVEQRKRNGKGTFTQTYPALWLKQHTNRDGYQQVGFSVDGRQHGPLVHRLVWEAFNGSIADGMEINHADSDPSNNCLSNLELTTHQQNVKHSVLYGNNTNATGFIGVVKVGNRYRAYANEPQTKKTIHIGTYDTRSEAARAYNAYIIERNWHLPPYEKALNDSESLL